MADSQAAFLYTEWKVFLDGVEVPHQGFTVTFGVDQTPQASIVLEPDPLLYQFRPETMVHIFCRDRFPQELGDVKDEDAFTLYFEGYTVGIQHVKSPTQRMVQLSAVGILMTLDTVRAFMSGLGPISYSPFFSGSVLPPITAGGLEQQNGLGVSPLLLSALVEGLVDEEAKGSGIAFRDPEKLEFSDRVIRLIGYLSNTNGLLRQRVLRQGLLNKIVSLPNTVIGDLVPLTIAKELLGNVQNRVTPENSVMDLVRHLISYGFYHLTPIPHPHRPSKQPPPQGEYAPFIGSDRDEARLVKFGIPRMYYRNDMVLHPDTFYALPPPCNIIFPDQIDQLQIGRMYLEEPTRHLIQDPFLESQFNTYSFFAAPAGLISSYLDDDREGATPASVFSTGSVFLRGADVELAGNSAYAYPANGAVDAESAVNLLGMISQAELEKGLIVSTAESPYQAFAALAYTSREADAPDRRGSQARSVQNIGDSLYRETMTQLAEYQLALLRYQRSGSVTLLGHRWLVPGFSTVIFDSDVSYFAVPTSLTFNVTAQGAESTTLQLDKTRPIPTNDIDELRRSLGAAVQRVTELVEAAEESVESVAQSGTDPIEQLAADAASVLPSFEQQLTSIATLRDWLSSVEFGLTDISVTPPIAGSKPISTSYLSTQVLTTGSVPFKVVSDPIQPVIAQANSATRTMLNIARTLLTQYQSFIAAGGGTALNPGLEEWLSFLAQLSGAGVPTSDPTNSGLLNLTIGIVPVVPLAVAIEGSANGALVSPLQALTLENAFEGAVYLERWAHSVLRSAQLVAETIVASNAGDTGAAQTAVRRQVDDELTKLVEDIDNEFNWPAPPVFFNRKLINLPDLDETYAGILGTRALYSVGEYADAAGKGEIGALITQVSELNERLVAATGRSEGLSALERLNYYLTYLQGIGVLNAIYPFSRSATTQGTAAPSAAKSWEDVTSQSGTAVGAIEWAHRTFFKRQVCTLGQFLEDHKLTLNRVNSGFPVPQQFLQMVAGTRKTAETGGFEWDDSIFSKLVDGRALKAQPTVQGVAATLGAVSAASVAAQLVGGVGLPVPTFNDDVQQTLDQGFADELVSAARKNASNRFLTTTARQQLVLDYSARHFGPRGFDGS